MSNMTYSCVNPIQLCPIQLSPQCKKALYVIISGEIPEDSSQGHIWAGSNKFSRKSKICEFLLWSHVKNKLSKSISGRDCPIISNKGEGVTPSVTTFHCHHSWTISPPWKYFTTLLLLTHIIVDTTQHSFCNNIKT